MGNAANEVVRFPRVLIFINGMMPTDEDVALRDRLRPNAAFRNAQAVGNMPMSPLEECDAVAGDHIPVRYSESYPNVNEFDGSHQIRMSDLDQYRGNVTSTSNERKRAAKPPGLGQSIEMGQGAPRPRGAIIQEDGGLVIPLSSDPNALPMFGAERAENALPGTDPANPPAGTNPHSLPPGGAVILPTGQDASGFSAAGALIPQPTGTGGFKAPEPATEDEEGEGEEGETGRKGRKRGAQSAS